MGIPGLWKILQPAGKTRSLTDISVMEGFQPNLSNLRGYRVGIDASIWLFHAKHVQAGRNPGLRTLFFRCAKLIHSPFLPLFVFDGQLRPDFKRGKKTNMKTDPLIPEFQRIIEAFGFEWITALGEAEAELAHMNQVGVVDGILSDDVDTFLFGAHTVIRNPSNSLLGNKSDPALNSVGKLDQNHTKVYRLVDITVHPRVGLTRGGMILIGLMKGGDYHPGGLAGCGIVIAHALARCGFGDSLLQAARDGNRKKLASFLVHWRHDLQHELLTNSRGYLSQVHPSLTDIPDSFPDIDVLLSYVKPLNQGTMGDPGYYQRFTWSNEPDLPKLAGICESKFGWERETVMKRFKTNIWFPVAMRILRRVVLVLDDQPQAMLRSITDKTLSTVILKHFTSVAPTTFEQYTSNYEPGEPFFFKIHSTRSHVSTDRILEYRVEIAPTLLERMAESGLKGPHTNREVPKNSVCEEDQDKKEKNRENRSKEGRRKTISDPDHHIRVWIPACMVDPAEPGLVAEHKAVQKKHHKATTIDHCKIIDGEQMEASVPQIMSDAPTSGLKPLLSLRGYLQRGENRGRVIRDLTKKKTTQPLRIPSGACTGLKEFYPTTQTLRCVTEKASSGRSTVHSEARAMEPSKPILSPDLPLTSHSEYRMQEEPQGPKTRTLETLSASTKGDPCALTLASGNDVLFKPNDGFPVTQPPLAVRAKRGRQKTASLSPFDSDSDLDPPKKTQRKFLNYASPRSGHSIHSGSSSTPPVPIVIEIPSDFEETSDLSPPGGTWRKVLNHTPPRSGHSAHIGSSSTSHPCVHTLFPGAIAILSDPEDVSPRVPTRHRKTSTRSRLNTRPSLPREVITISSDSEDSPTPSAVSLVQVNPSANSKKPIPSKQDLIDLT